MGTEWPAVIAIVGPTAVGKSALALNLARDLGAAIVSADSRQVYRYMNVGTAKPSPVEQAEVDHYMLDLIQPDQQYSAQLFQQEGRRVLRLLKCQGRPALVVGGTGFYVQALLDGISMPQVAPDAALRERLRRQATDDGVDALHARLEASDPVSAARIHPHNLPRVVRALEIVEHLGGPVPRTDLQDPVPALYIGLTMERRRLREIADRRVHAQVQAGLAEETRALLAMGFSAELPPLQGFAYLQMCQFLSGAIDLHAATQGYKTAQHQFIRRQMTWFRKDSRITWLDAGEDALTKAFSLVRAWPGLG